MQLIHDTYAKQLVQLCETETQRRWRRDKLVATEYQVLDTLLNYLENLPKDKLDLVVATFGPSIPKQYAEEMVGHIIGWGVPKDTWNDPDGRRWLGELMSELRIEQMHEDFDDVFYYLFQVDEYCCTNEECQGCWDEKE